MKYVFKRAETDDEFRQLFRLNHRVFAEEIGQHQTREDHVLIDRYHDSQIYFIATFGAAMAGMISIHSGRPYSIEQRLEDPEVVEKIGSSPLEVRMLAVDSGHRGSMVMFGLFGMVFEYAVAKQHDVLLISAISSQLEMYTRLGFRPLGPPVGMGQAEFVPMWARLTDLPRKAVRHSMDRRAKAQIPGDRRL